MNDVDQGTVTRRPIVAADAGTVADFHATSWSAYRGTSATSTSDADVAADRQEAWNQPAGLAVDSHFGFIAESAGQAVGFVFMLGAEDARWGTLIDNLHVVPGMKGRGIGRRSRSGGARNRAPIPERARPSVRVRGERRRAAVLRQRRRPGSRAFDRRAPRRRRADALARAVGRCRAAARVGMFGAEVGPGVTTGRRESWPFGPAVAIVAGIAILALPADVERPPLLPISPGHTLSLVDAGGSTNFAAVSVAAIGRDQAD